MRVLKSLRMSGRNVNEKAKYSGCMGLAFIPEPLEQRFLMSVSTTFAVGESADSMPLAYITANSAPANVSVGPSTSTIVGGTFRTYTATWTDADDNFKGGYLRFVNSSTRRVFEAIYVARTNLLVVLNDAGNGYTQGIPPGRPGAGYAVANGALDVGHTTVNRSNGELTVEFVVALSQRMGGDNKIYLRVRDLDGLEDPDVYENVSGAHVTVTTRPTSTSLSPIVVTDVPNTFRTFTATYSDGDDDFKVAGLRFNYGERIPIEFDYDAQRDRLYINAGPPSTNNFLKPGSPGGLIVNKFGTLDAEHTTVIRTNGVLTVNFRVALSGESTGINKAYLRVSDLAENEDGYRRIENAAWTITNTAPRNASLTPVHPISQPGFFQTFTATYEDAEANIAFAALRFDNISGQQFEAWYIPQDNLFYVRGVILGKKPGEFGTIPTANGTLDVQNSSVVKNGPTLTINFRVSLSSMMLGTNTAYLRVRDKDNLIDGSENTDGVSWTIVNPSIFTGEGSDLWRHSQIVDLL